jgi:hypothetical protein
MEKKTSKLGFLNEETTLKLDTDNLDLTTDDLDWDGINGIFIFFI